MFQRIVEIVPEENGSESNDLKKLVLEQKESGDEAVVVWDAALVLAYFLQKHQQSLQFQSGPKTVVELGSGTGIVGLVASVLG